MDRTIGFLEKQVAALEDENAVLMARAGIEVGAVSTAADWENPAWLSHQIGVSVVTAKVEPVVGHGGMVAGLHRITMTLEGGGSKSAIVKTTKNHPDPEPAAVGMGLPREAFFFDSFAQHLGVISLPAVWNSHGNMSTGNKVLVMEDVSDCACAGFFYGPTSPLNYGKDLVKLTKDFPYSVEQVTAASFEQAAKLHAQFWSDKSLLKHSWLKGAAWICGNKKEGWDAWQNMASAAWTKTSAAIKARESEVNWDENLVACMDASMSKISWEDFQAELKTRQYMFIHGDFHPANIMVRRPAAGAAAGAPPALVVLDFEAVGMGCDYCGPAECAQLLISHMAPEVRRECEDRLLQGYHTKLASLIGADRYSMEQCKADYAAYGTARWIWLLGLLSGMPGIPVFMLQTWNNQLAAFMADHGVTPENVQMPGSC
jgi:hypothetical protein